jgi:hypothetical protein
MLRDEFNQLTAESTAGYVAGRVQSTDCGPSSIPPR